MAESLVRALRAVSRGLTESSIKFIESKWRRLVILRRRPIFLTPIEIVVMEFPAKNHRRCRPSINWWRSGTRRRERTSLCGPTFQFSRCVCLGEALSGKWSA